MHIGRVAFAVATCQKGKQQLNSIGGYFSRPAISELSSSGRTRTRTACAAVYFLDKSYVPIESLNQASTDRSSSIFSRFSPRASGGAVHGPLRVCVCVFHPSGSVVILIRDSNQTHRRMTSINRECSRLINTNEQQRNQRAGGGNLPAFSLRATERKP